jgi:hypothetical protein
MPISTFCHSSAGRTRKLFRRTKSLPRGSRDSLQQTCLMRDIVLSVKRPVRGHSPLDDATLHPTPRSTPDHERAAQNVPVRVELSSSDSYASCTLCIRHYIPAASFPCSVRVHALSRAVATLQSSACINLEIQRLAFSTRTAVSPRSLIPDDSFHASKQPATR